jgi:anti-sigma regulatory factor (Ser/Thr protein kinase)
MDREHQSGSGVQAGLTEISGWPVMAMTELRHRVSAYPAELAGARQVVRDWCQRVGLSPLRLERPLIAIGEALRNAVEHAYLGMPRGPIDLYLRLDAQGRPFALVQDCGRWHQTVQTPSAAPGAGQQRGRGLDLIRGVMDQVDVRREPDGTTITFTDLGMAHPLWGPEPDPG